MLAGALLLTEEAGGAVPVSALEAEPATAPAGDSLVLDGAGEGDAAPAPALDTSAAVLDQEAQATSLAHGADGTAAGEV